MVSSICGLHGSTPTTVPFIISHCHRDLRERMRNSALQLALTWHWCPPSKVLAHLSSQAVHGLTSVCAPSLTSCQGQTPEPVSFPKQKLNLEPAEWRDG